MTLQQDNLTLHDLRRLEEEPGVEFVNGQIVEKPVSFDSARIEARIIRLLQNHVDQSQDATVCGPSLAYRCFPKEPSRFRKPDASVLRNDRLKTLDDPDPGMMPIPPDLAVEVLSPTDFAYDVDEKLEDYLSNGFKLIWVVNPLTRTVTIHRGDGSIGRLHENDEIAGESALPGFSCKVAQFFAQTIQA